MEFAFSCLAILGEGTILECINSMSEEYSLFWKDESEFESNFTSHFDFNRQLFNTHIYREAHKPKRDHDEQAVSLCMLLLGVTQVQTKQNKASHSSNCISSLSNVKFHYPAKINIQWM